jgi:hypothetical protein
MAFFYYFCRDDGMWTHADDERFMKTDDDAQDAFPHVRISQMVFNGFNTNVYEYEQR